MSKVKMLPRKYIEKITKNNEYAFLITNEYINDETVLDIYCQRHELEYKHSLKNAMRYNGCSMCKEEKRQEEFKKKVFLKNPHIEVLGIYIKQGCHILCRCRIHNIEFSPNSVSLIQGDGGCPLCLKEKDYTRNSSDNIKSRFHNLNPTLKIVDENVKMNTFMNVYCNVCDNQFSKFLSSPFIYSKETKCLVCINRVIAKGFNDVATVRNDLIKYFKDKDDVYKYGSGSTQKLIFICPDCGYEKTMKIEVLAREGFGCPCCGDGISYPNKFIRSLINQLPVNKIKFEYSPKWANGYFYDVYFEYMNSKYIIEVDGAQHYKKSSNFKLTLEEIQSRDREKNILAKRNECIMIRIDAQKSNEKYLCNQIKNSLLSDLFDLDMINWDKCGMTAASNLAKEICIYANNNMPEKYNDLAEVFHIGKDTLHKYLMQGLKFGWCSEKVIEKLTVPKKVSVYDKLNNFLYIFNGMQKCSEEMSAITNEKYSVYGISNNCHNLTNYYKDYIFRFTYNTI